MSPTTRSNETTIKSLKAKQLLLIQRLKRINEFVNNQENPIHSIQARLDAAHNAFKELDNLDASIQDHLEDQNLDAEINNVRVQFEELYFNIIAQIKARTDDHNENKIKNIPATVDINNSTHKIQLPAITLPKFNGSYLDWLAFRDVYLSLIHNNLTLSNIEKMHYLRSSLTGEALKSVESLAVSSQNYDAAWNLLINRYENKRLIVQAHILNLSPITKPTFQGLRNIIDIVKANVESLQILGIPIQHWDAILITIVSDKLDFQTNKEWHLTLDKDIPTFQQLFDFLEHRSQYFESFNNINNKQVGYTNTKYTGHTKSPSINHITTNKQNCIICNNLNHSIYQCPQFLKLNISNRIRTVNDLKLCMNCLRSNHNLKQCKSNSVCKHCNNKHNSLLHEEKSQTIINEVEPSTSSNHSSNTKDMLTEVLLSTAIVTVLDEQGKKHDCRILLDNGSQSNFITSKFCKKLNLRTQKVDHYVCGISANPSKVSEVVDVTINSQQNINYSTKINCLVLQKITNKLPSSSFPINNLKIPQNIQLADKNFNISKEIDMLVGAQLFFDIIKAEKLQLGDKHLYLYDTHLGWLIGGSVSFPSGHKNSSNCNISLKSIEIEKLNMQVAKFWEVEGNNCSIPQLTPEEAECEQYFVNTFQRNCDERFIVQLPFKNNIFYNGNSQEMATQCFLNLEKTLNKSTQLKQDYQNFIHEYLQLNHMEKVPANEIINSTKGYVALFVCLCTRALHIELVTDLTTESYLNALRRFISRRGNIKTIYSDNASTFVGATNELKEIKTVITNPIVSEILNVDNIKWSFIPPRSPHFGGLWEAGIKSVKFHLKRVIGDDILCYDELYTILTRIEACLNSRPLVPLSNDPKDFQALTPGHFLIGDAITAPYEYDLHELQSNRLSRWQMLENMRQHFWKRRRREYLTQLQQRTKWKPQKDNLQPGTMVLLMEENTPPLCWPLGRIHQIHPGKDGLIRVVTIQTNKGYYKRAINKICILPITD